MHNNIVCVFCIWVWFGELLKFLSQSVPKNESTRRRCVYAFFARLRRVCLKAFSHHLSRSYTCAHGVCVCFLQLRGNTRDVLFRCIYAARVSSALFAYFVNISGAATSNAAQISQSQFACKPSARMEFVCMIFNNFLMRVYASAALTHSKYTTWRQYSMRAVTHIIHFAEKCWL